MLHFLNKEQPSLEFRYSHKQPENIPDKKQNVSKALKESKIQEETKSEEASFDINTADQDSLMRIPGIGPKMAETILNYRQKNGVFKKAEDLLNVPGIGEKKLERMRPYLQSLDSKFEKEVSSLLCSQCGTSLPKGNTKGGYEKPYCPKCLHYLKKGEHTTVS
jgi:comEA protein